MGVKALTNAVHNATDVWDKNLKQFAIQPGGFDGKMFYTAGSLMAALRGVLEEPEILIPYSEGGGVPDDAEGSWAVIRAGVPYEAPELIESIHSSELDAYKAALARSPGDYTKREVRFVKWGEELDPG